MSEQDTSETKLKRLTGSKDLSSAIEKLEKKKAVMEVHVKGQAHRVFVNLNLINALNETVQNVKRSSYSRNALFKEALAFGSGYLSKNKLAHLLKSALIKTFFRSSASGSSLSLRTATDNQEHMKINDNSTDNKKENIYMDSQIEKVKAKPEVLPKPTYWPFFLAMGLAFLGWGLLTTWLISLAGFIILVIALTGWINILRHE